MFKEDEFIEIDARQKLPSGLIVELEEWTTGDVNKISTSTGINRIKAIGKVIGRCRVVDDPRGVYPQMSPGDNVDPSILLVGDRVVLVILQRIYTHGPWMGFEYLCEFFHCGHKNKKPEIDLRRLLLPAIPGMHLPQEDYDCLTEEEKLYFEEGKVEATDEGYYVLWPSLGEEPILIGDEEKDLRKIFWKPLNEKGLEVFKNGNTGLYTDRKGNEIEWKHLTEADEIALAKIGSSNLEKLKLETITRRIKKITVPARTESEEPKEIKSERQIKAWVVSWSARESNKFLDHVNSHDSGIDTAVGARCEKCNGSQEVEFPMDIDFFSPSTM